jgi:hypothetical protein
MTRFVVVRYTTTPQARDQNTQLVSEVYAALAEAQPEGLRYATLLLEDSRTFVHVAAEEGSDNALPRLPAFQEFQRDLASRVLAAPDARSATLIGSHHLF